MGGRKTLHLGVHGRPHLEGRVLLLLFSQQPQLWEVSTAPSYIAGPIVMAQATGGDKYGKALPLILTLGRGSF